MADRMDRRERKLYEPRITLGNIITVVMFILGCVGFFMKYSDRLLLVEAAQLASDRSDVEFRREVLQKLQDLQTDIREIRNSTGVRWRDLPPSPYRKEQ